MKVNVGFLSPHSGGVGAELDLALIAGFLVILLAGAGRISLDHTLGIERSTAWETKGPEEDVRRRAGMVTTCYTAISTLG